MSTASVVWRCESCKQKNRIRVERWTEGPACGHCGEPLATDRPLEVQGTKDFQQIVLESGLPVLVDFWAPWCGPCRMVAPTLQRIAYDYNGRLLVIKINTDKNQEIAAKFGIQSIPTLMLFSQGKMVERMAGALPEPQMRQWLNAAF